MFKTDRVKRQGCKRYLVETMWQNYFCEWRIQSFVWCTCTWRFCRWIRQSMGYDPRCFPVRPFEVSRRFWLVPEKRWRYLRDRWKSETLFVKFRIRWSSVLREAFHNAGSLHGRWSRLRSQQGSCEEIDSCSQFWQWLLMLNQYRPRRRRRSNGLVGRNLIFSPIWLVGWDKVKLFKSLKFSSTYFWPFPKRGIWMPISPKQSKQQMLASSNITNNGFKKPADEKLRKKFHAFWKLFGLQKFISIWSAMHWELLPEDKKLWLQIIWHGWKVFVTNLNTHKFEQKLETQH